MHSRIFVAIALILVSSASGRARAQDAWTEARVAAIARQRAPVVRSTTAAAQQARARATGIGLHPNPSLEWERQESFAPNAQSQDLVRATIPLALSGERRAARWLAELEAVGAEAEAASAARLVTAQALSLFYEALAAQRRLGVLRETQSALDEASRVLASRQAAGEAAGYDTARLALASELARSRLRGVEIDLAETLEGLAALLGEPVSASALSGDFEVAQPETVDALVARAEREHPLLETLDTRRTTARRARDAAATAWIPELAVVAGYNRQDGPRVGHGYAVGLQVDIPLFDRGQGKVAEADAVLASSGAYADALRASIRARVRGAHARLEGLLLERDRLARATGDTRELLLRAARAGFRGGERSLVELLDAHRAARDVTERLLALDLAVRLADIHLRRTTGAL